VKEGAFKRDKGGISSISDIYLYHDTQQVIAGDTRNKQFKASHPNEYFKIR
jgi:hypothetical protein